MTWHLKLFCTCLYFTPSCWVEASYDFLSRLFPDNFYCGCSAVKLNLLLYRKALDKKWIWTGDCDTAHKIGIKQSSAVHSQPIYRMKANKLYLCNLKRVSLCSSCSLIHGAVTNASRTEYTKCSIKLKLMMWRALDTLSFAMLLQSFTLIFVTSSPISSFHGVKSFNLSCANGFLKRVFHKINETAREHS